MSNVELSCARALPADGQSVVRAMGTMGMMGAPGAMVMDEMGAMWERCGSDVDYGMAGRDTRTWTL